MIFLDKIEPLKEDTSIYIGKTKNLQKIEKILKSCENPYADDHTLIYSKVAAKQAELEKLFAEEFNCGKFFLPMEPIDSLVVFQGVESVFRDDEKAAEDFINMLCMQIIPNGYTFGINDFWKCLRAFSLSPDKIIVRSSNGGYKFANKNDAPVIYVRLTPVMIARCNAPQLIAIILHEVGHNFYYKGVIGLIWQIVGAPLNKIRDFASNIKKNLYQMGASVAIKYLGPFIEKILKSILPENYKKSLDDFLTNFAKNLNAYHWFSSPMMAQFIMKKFEEDPLWMINDETTNIVSSLVSSRYEDEKFADNFAATYGYGKDLIQGLLFSQFSSANSGYVNKKENDLKDAVLSFPNTIAISIISIPNEHPGMYARYDNVKKFLKEQIAKEKDKRLKKEMEICLKNLEKLFDTNQYTLGANKLFGFPADIVKNIASKIFFHNEIGDILSDVKVVNSSFNPFLCDMRRLSLDQNIKQAIYDIKNE